MSTEAKKPGAASVPILLPDSVGASPLTPYIQPESEVMRKGKAGGAGGKHLITFNLVAETRKTDEFVPIDVKLDALQDREKLVSGGGALFEMHRDDAAFTNAPELVVPMDYASDVLSSPLIAVGDIKPPIIPGSGPFYALFDKVRSVLDFTKYLVVLRPKVDNSGDRARYKFLVKTVVSEERQVIVFSHTHVRLIIEVLTSAWSARCGLPPSPMAPFASHFVSKKELEKANFDDLLSRNLGDLSNPENFNLRAKAFFIANFVCSRLATASAQSNDMNIIVNAQKMACGVQIPTGTGPVFKSVPDMDKERVEIKTTLSSKDAVPLYGAKRTALLFRLALTPSNHHMSACQPLAAWTGRLFLEAGGDVKALAQGHISWQTTSVASPYHLEEKCIREFCARITHSLLGTISAIASKSGKMTSALMKEFVSELCLKCKSSDAWLIARALPDVNVVLENSKKTLLPENVKQIKEVHEIWITTKARMKKDFEAQTLSVRYFEETAYDKAIKAAKAGKSGGGGGAKPAIAEARPSAGASAQSGAAPIAAAAAAAAAAVPVPVVVTSAPAAAVAAAAVAAVPSEKEADAPMPDADAVPESKYGIPKPVTNGKKRRADAPKPAAEAKKVDVDLSGDESQTQVQTEPEPAEKKRKVIVIPNDPMETEESTQGGGADADPHKNDERFDERSQAHSPYTQPPADPHAEEEVHRAAKAAAPVAAAAVVFCPPPSTSSMDVVMTDVSAMRTELAALKKSMADLSETVAEMKKQTMASDKAHMECFRDVVDSAKNNAMSLDKAIAELGRSIAVPMVATFNRVSPPKDKA